MQKKEKLKAQCFILNKTNKANLKKTLTLTQSQVRESLL